MDRSTEEELRRLRARLERLERMNAGMNVFPNLNRLGANTLVQGHLTLPEQPDTPADAPTTHRRIYPKSDGWYDLDDEGTETKLGTGGGGTVSEGPGIDLVGDAVGLGGDTILLYDSAGAPVAEYAMSSAGLDAALAAATSGQVVWLPAGTIAGDHTIPGLVHLRADRLATTLTGKFTLSSGSSMTGVKVVRSANDANELDGVVGPASGSAYLYGCVIEVTQAGAGASHGIHGGAGNTYLKSCEVNTVTGTDLYRTTGSIYADETALLGLVKCSE